MLGRVGLVAVLVVVLLLFVFLNVAKGQGRLKNPKAGEDRAGQILLGGLKRTYIVHLPVGYEKGKSMPLLFVLHGGGGDGRKVARLTGFSRAADSAGFIVVYPNAVNGHWNDGRQVRRFKSQRTDIDDVGFIAKLADRFVRDLGADPLRVYVTGISNGGMMCHRLACELSSRIAAIAPVAAALPEPMVDSCRPERGVSVLAINGTADPLVPWEGGGVGLRAKRGEVISVPATVEFWVRANGCGTDPEIAEMPGIDPYDGIRVVRERYSGGRDSSEVVLYRVEGGGHTWPSGARRAARFGETARDIDATRVILEFFLKHRRT
jgi:polyhydroxybutyrate depolymerase